RWTPRAEDARPAVARRRTRPPARRRTRPPRARDDPACARRDEAGEGAGGASPRRQRAEPLVQAPQARPRLTPQYLARSRRWRSTVRDPPGFPRALGPARGMLRGRPPEGESTVNERCSPRRCLLDARRSPMLELSRLVASGLIVGWMAGSAAARPS